MLEILALPIPLIVTFMVATFFAAMVQGTIGFGFAIVSVPLLLNIDPRLAPEPQLFVQLPLSLLMFYRERKSADYKAAVWTTVGRVPGTVIGLGLLRIASQSWLDVIIGGLVLLGALLLASGGSIKRNKITEFFAGGFSGLGHAVSSIGGPPLALLYKDDKGPTIRATISLIFAVGLVMTIAGRVVEGHIEVRHLALGALGFPALIGGLYCSRFLLERVEGAPLRRGILFIAGLAAVLLLQRGLSELL